MCVKKFQVRKGENHKNGSRTQKEKKNKPEIGVPKASKNHFIQALHINS